MYIPYKEKLRNPKWQKKKSEILIRDNYTCKVCGCTDKNLQVHHYEYLGDLNPWDYPDDMLITLCEDCHKKENGREELERHLAITLKMNGFLYDDLVAFSSAIDTNNLFRYYILNYIRKFNNGKKIY